jgi:hypothetical protein
VNAGKEGEQMKREKWFFHFSLVIITCSLLIGCDLFNGPVQRDFLAQIDEEIAWSNSERLTVRIDYPSEWGTSNPPTGIISLPVRDIRQGYSFEVEFTPDTAYSFQGWRAYDASVLNALGDWLLDITLLDGVPQLSGVETPELPARGGTGSFKIDTVTPVTLVPWCRSEAYVIRTDPQTETRNSTVMRVYDPSVPVTVYFNSALDPRMTWDFGTGMVDIKARPIDTIETDGAFEDFNERFDRIEYANRAGQYAVTIYPKETDGPLPNYQIEVTIGPDIRNAQGGLMDSPEVIYYKVSNLVGLDARIDSWSAAYNTNGTIFVTCIIDGENAAEATATEYYQMNQGSSQMLALSRSGNTFTGTITGAGSLDASSIGDGKGVSNIREYRIFMELKAGGYTVDDVNFKIWNFSGLSVSDANHAIEVTSETGDDDDRDGTISLSAIPANSTKQYVLANDMYVSNHTPIANFQGNFYGNGHKVTINSFANSQYTGLFGNTNNALIRDLTLEFNSVTIGNNAAIQYLGGIAGNVGGSTEIRNIITSGSLDVAGLTNTGEKYIGGITGNMASTVTIANIRAGLDLSATATGPNNVYFGGITGNTGTNTLIDMSEVIVTGTLSVNNAGTGATYAGGLFGNGNVRTGTSINNSFVTGDIRCTTGTGELFCGGLAGLANSLAVNNSGYEQGSITAKGAGTINLGSGFGKATNVALANFSSLAPSISADSAGNIYAGGLIGFLENGTLTGCYARTEVYALGGGTVSAGGLVGHALPNNNDNSSISKCYATGHVIAELLMLDLGKWNLLCAGGLIGYYGREAGTGSISVTDSYALGNVGADAKSDDGVYWPSQTYAGGLVGHFNSASENENSGIRHCFAIGDVRAKSYNLAPPPFYTGGSLYVAGIVGLIERGFLLNNAARNEFIMSMGGGRNLWNNGRVFGSTQDIPTNNNNIINNYALRTMMIQVNHYYIGWSFGTHWDGYTTPTEEQQNYYYTNNPNVPGDDAAIRRSKYGMSTDYGSFFNSDFWSSGGAMVGFSPEIWNISAAMGRGYPTLLGVGGQ